MPISHAGPNDNAFSARQAVNHLGKLINDASPMRCYLALNLLDLLVINCGYPVHLMVAKKDFLNKLVYRFPPQPDGHLDKCHYVIMSLLKKWSVALCERSRHGADFGNIRLMLALLKSRSFPIPEVEPAAIDALLASENATLQTKEEIEAEERTVLEARLEDLLHRGEPADLVAANALMKKLVGYTNEDSNYSSAESRINKELDLLGEKIDLMESMQHTKSEEYMNLYGECRAVIPRMFQLANSELSEGVMMKLLALNQRLHEAIGDEEGDGTPELMNEGLNMDSLIDFDRTVPEPPAPKPVVSDSTRNIMELYKLETPKLGPSQIAVNVFTGSKHKLLVDIVSIDGIRYLRAFNGNGFALCNLDIDGRLIEVVGPLETVTMPHEGEAKVSMDVSYSMEGEAIAEKISLSF